MGTSYLLDTLDWDALIRGIKNRKVTVFLGAGASYSTLKKAGSTMANDWADEIKYPFTETHERSNLINVSQYYATQQSHPAAKQFLLDKLMKYDEPVFPSDQSPHSLLAELPITRYITTNYDDLMEKALEAQDKYPIVELCKWNNKIEQTKLKQGKSDDAPLIFHLHGHRNNVNSMVLTEDDYIRFLLQLARVNDYNNEGESGQPLLPPVVIEALTDNIILFIGYSFQDINFRVIFRGIFDSVESIAAQKSFIFQYGGKRNKRAMEYFEQYYNKFNMGFVWQDALIFTQELNRRWKEAENG